MPNSILLLLGALLLAMNQGVNATPPAYSCEVVHVYDLADDASLKKSGFEETMKGSIFSVSRVTGEITGKVVQTNMASSTRIVNAGSEKDSFKAVADFEGQVQVIEVQEFKPGASKPFVASSMGGRRGENAFSILPCPKSHCIRRRYTARLNGDAQPQRPRSEARRSASAGVRG